MRSFKAADHLILIIDNIDFGITSIINSFYVKETRWIKITYNVPMPGYLIATKPLQNPETRTVLRINVHDRG